MVIYRGADGKPGYQQAEDIHDAVTFVEQMRNEEGVDQARIFRLEEVNFEYRPYYRVELNTGGSVEPQLVSPSPPMMGAPNAPAPAPAMGGIDDGPITVLDDTFDVVDASGINVDEVDSEAVGTNGSRRGLFGR
ncbi:MAG: hypothetical protein ACK5PP_07025 [Acidimicrobiales bacterium]